MHTVGYGLAVPLTLSDEQLDDGTICAKTHYFPQLIQLYISKLFNISYCTARVLPVCD